MDAQHRISFRIGFGIALTLCAAVAWGSAKVTGITLVNSVASGATTVDKTYLVKVSNQAPPLTNAYATLTSTTPSVTVIQGVAQIGDLPAYSQRTSTGTITIRQRRGVEFEFEDESKKIAWSVKGIPVVGGGNPTATINATTAVVAYSSVILDGTASTDPTAPIISYVWTQTAGPTVGLSNPNTAKALFTAPQVTTVTALTFSLTVTDLTGAKSTATASVSVSPASTAQLAVTFLSARLLAAVPANPHTDYTPADGPPLAGSTSEIEVTLTGAVLSPTFTLVDANGNVLNTATLAVVGNPSIQPLTFAGSITIPTVPFTLAASGTTADGQTFAVQLASLFTPMNMSIGFSPSVLWLLPGATGNSQLTLYNSGATATFTIQYSDPSSLLSAGTPTSIPIAAATSASVPITVTYPANIAGVIGPAVTATVSVSGDASRTGTASLTLWQGVAP